MFHAISFIQSYKKSQIAGSRYAINNGEKWIKDYQVTSMGMMNSENADAFLALRLGLMSKYKPGGCDFNTLSRAVEYDILSGLMRYNFYRLYQYMFLEIV